VEPNVAGARYGVVKEDRRAEGRAFTQLANGLASSADPLARRSSAIDFTRLTCKRFSLA